MDTKDVKTVLMYGPMISDPSKLEERQVPEADVQAYVAMGWQAGALPKGAKAEDSVIPAPAQPVVDSIESAPEPEAEPKKKGKK